MQDRFLLRREASDLDVAHDVFNGLPRYLRAILCSRYGPSDGSDLELAVSMARDLDPAVMDFARRVYRDAIGVDDVHRRWLLRTIVFGGSISYGELAEKVEVDFRELALPTGLGALDCDIDPRYAGSRETFKGDVETMKRIVVDRMARVEIAEGSPV